MEFFAEQTDIDIDFIFLNQQNVSRKSYLPLKILSIREGGQFICIIVFLEEKLIPL